MKIIDHLNMYLDQCEEQVQIELKNQPEYLQEKMDLMQILKNYVRETTETLNAQMGGERSWCFLKAPTNFLKYLTDVSEIFAFKAHMKLMKKVKKKGSEEFIDIFSKTAKEEMLKQRQYAIKQM